MNISRPHRLAQIQTIKRGQLLAACQGERETEAMQSLLSKCPGEDLGQIRSDLVTLTDQKMGRYNKGALASVGLGVASTAAAALSGHPWLAAGCALGGAVSAGLCINGTLQAYQENTFDLQLLLHMGGRTLSQ